MLFRSSIVNSFRTQVNEQVPEQIWEDYMLIKDQGLSMLLEIAHLGAKPDELKQRTSFNLSIAEKLKDMDLISFTVDSKAPRGNQIRITLYGEILALFSEFLH